MTPHTTPAPAFHLPELGRLYIRRLYTDVNETGIVVRQRAHSSQGSPLARRSNSLPVRRRPAGLCGIIVYTVSVCIIVVRVGDMDPWAGGAVQ